jgi:phospholipase C
MKLIARILLLVSLAVTLAHAQTQSLVHFQHIIVLVQENRTPDNLFGSNPTFEAGVNLVQPAGGQWCLGACFDPSHSHAAWENDYSPNWCNPKYANAGACTAKATYCNFEEVGPGVGELPVPSCPQETYVSGGYDNSVIYPYFEIAKTYGFANYMFQTNQGPSMPAHEFLFAGTSAPLGNPSLPGYNDFQADNPLGNLQENTGCTAPSGETVPLINPSGQESGSGGPSPIFPCLHDNSLPTLLDAKSISWKYYTDQVAGSTNGIWNAPAAIYAICQPNMPTGGQCVGPDYTNNVVVNNPTQVLSDLGVDGGTCDLPAVSWVVPPGDRTDHPGFGKNQTESTATEGGPSWIADVINAVGQSPCQNEDTSSYWNTTAILVTWDDWGGFYDHVQPYEVLVNTAQQPCAVFGCGYVSGFRVPLLVISAYTPEGYVSGAVPSGGGNSPPSSCPITTTPQYCHDFGSILAFMEYNFLGLSEVGQINPQYRFADAFAPDSANGNIPLSDFFPIPSTQPRPFTAIYLPPGAPTATDYINYTGPITDPDNDAIDND